ncbi:efflux RND transporter permease subunit [Leptolyngbya sp. CCY15150]|uniref:efflux RND transporter permease subunit n=1 Tax=Leptolyngbya sp. CCY15150 TaxID=2767772 RepID=UPI00194F6227|nr:efflux RND transporter permease subunit [Leptolyngbya sp. CCY15150]
MQLSAWSIRKPVPTLVGILVFMVAGLMAFTQLGIDSNPNIDIPAVSITVTQAGAGPSELETQVTRKVEDAVAGLGNIDDINSVVTDGSSTTTISFVLGTDSDRATNDVRNAIAQIRQDLPEEINEPVVQRLEFAGGPIMTYVVTSEQQSVEQLSNLVDRTISRELLSVPGVSQIRRVGGLDREIRINLSPERLQALGITATQVNDQVRALNVDLPGGRSDAGGSENNIRTLGSADTVEALSAYPIGLPAGGTVPLNALGQVEDSFGEVRQQARFVDTALQSEALPVVAFSVLRSTGSTLVSVEEGVRAAVERLQTTLPEDVRLELVVTQADPIRQSSAATQGALVMGSILTVIVVGLFLRDWRPTLITALALPLSIVPTFLVMRSLDYTLNGMTLLALALAMGNLVDDAICMIENIDQHLQMGKKPMRAALDASAEIGFAVIATTATIVAVFVPVAFMGGVPGQFFQPFGITVAVATMFSTLVAVTVTPMMAAYLLKPSTQAPRARFSPEVATPSRSRPRTYRGIITWALRHRLVTLAIALLFFIGSLQLVPLIPTGLFSAGDTGLSTVSIELPPGSPLSETDRLAQRVTQQVQEHPAVASVLVEVGGDGSDAAKLTINLKPRAERQVRQPEFEREMRQQFGQIPGARISFESQGAAGNSQDLRLVLTSENADALTETAIALEQQMRQVTGLVDVNSSASQVRPEILIVPDPQRAADLGVTVQAIARTASIATIGATDANSAKFDLPDRQIPIRVQLNPDTRSDLDTLRNLRIPSQSGAMVSLSAVADIRLGSGPATIERFDRARQVTLGANLEGLSLGEAFAQVETLPALQNLPPEVAQRPAGDAEIMRDIFSRFLQALGTGVLCIYAILVLLYNGFLYPFVILTALPLSLGGALIALMITQKELGLFALIGIVLLMGLVTKNAILLVDSALANQRDYGMPQFRAVMESGVSRLRPILMTTFSTIAGMIPIALEIGADAETRSPMAIAVIGGMVTATLLTLVVVPVIFTYIDGFQWRMGRWLGSDRLEEESATPVHSHPSIDPDPQPRT